MSRSDPPTELKFVVTNTIPSSLETYSAQWHSIATSSAPRYCARVSQRFCGSAIFGSRSMTSSFGVARPHTPSLPSQGSNIQIISIAVRLSADVSPYPYRRRRRSGDRHVRLCVLVVSRIRCAELRRDVRRSFFIIIKSRRWRKSTLVQVSRPAPKRSQLCGKLIEHCSPDRRRAKRRLDSASPTSVFSRLYCKVARNV
jgi:hypothetical protein